MRMARRAKGVAIGTVVIGLGLVGCGPNTATEGTNSQQTSVQVTNPNPAAGPTAPAPGAPPPPEGAPPAPPPGAPPIHHYTIVDLIRDNRIVETQLHPGDPGAPIVNLPTPPGWTDAGGSTPAWAWSAIYFTDPAMSADPPSIVTLVSKLTGNGAARFLSYAPGELRNMADFEGDAGTVEKVSGFNAYQLGGTFTRKDGVKRAIVQTTVLIPAPDGAFILQSNADGVADQLGLLRDTMRIMDEQAAITL
jgi:hypothetical protein